MISGLAGRTYEGRLKELGIVTLEERRHQMDMQQTYKILSGKEKVVPSCWFTMASDSERVTRQSADPLNIRLETPRLDIRRYFYSQRVVYSWNSVPHDIKKISVCECLQKCLQKAQRCYACTRLIDFLD
jgi:ribonuclease P/MRP protein subunit RPP40